MIRLQEIRRAKKISQQKLADLSGVPLRTIQDIERQDNCMVSNALKLAKALGVSLDTLCTLDDTPYEAQAENTRTERDDRNIQAESSEKKETPRARSYCIRLTITPADDEDF